MVVLYRVYLYTGIYTAVMINNEYSRVYKSQKSIKLRKQSVRVPVCLQRSSTGQTNVLQIKVVLSTEGGERCIGPFSAASNTTTEKRLTVTHGLVQGRGPVTGDGPVACTVPTQHCMA